MTGAQSRAAESVRAELDRVRGAAEEQVALARQDAAREAAAGLEAQVAAGEEARAGLQARAEQADARLAEARRRPSGLRAELDRVRKAAEEQVALRRSGGRASGPRRAGRG